MKLQDQVAPLEQSERLKELGIKQDSLFYHTHSDWGVMPKSSIDFSGNPTSAFTVAELGEMITGTIIGSTYWLRNFHGMNIQLVIGNVYHNFSGETEAQCRASMLIHLLESKLLTAEEVNSRL